MPSRIAKFANKNSYLPHRDHRSKKGKKGMNTKFKRKQRLIAEAIKKKSEKRELQALRKLVDVL